MPTQCAYMLCRNKPKGLVRMAVLDSHDLPRGVEPPMCESCADVVEQGIKEGARPHITPGEAIYLGDLNGVLPRRPR